jgi:PD-(D/E)XK nuclease superfamily
MVKISYGSPPGTQITDYIKSGLQTIEKRSKRERLHASNAGHCGRRSVLSMTKSNDELVSPASALYFKIGNSIEEVVLDALYHVGVLVFRQYKLHDEQLNLTGIIDGIVFANGALSLLEIKSCGALPEKPKPEHLAQSFLYSALTGLNAKIIYVSRNVATWNGELLIREFTLPDNKDEMLKYVKQAAIARVCLSKKLLPPMPNGFKKSNCSNCPFIPHCWNETGFMVDIDYHGLRLPTSEELMAINTLSDDLSLEFLSEKMIEIRRTKTKDFFKEKGRSGAAVLLKISDL